MVLSQRVGRAFYGRFSSLRSAQREAIDPILSGHDVLVLSRTGSGKTEAVLAPLIDRHAALIAEDPGCLILHISPTKALANDLLRRLETPIESLGLTVGIRHGDRNDLRRSRKPNLLVTTPESLDVMLSSREGAILSVRAVVLDEVHLTYNTQRGFQLAVLLRRLEQRVGHPLQVVGLSATVASASDIWGFFRPGEHFTVIPEHETKSIDYHVCEAATPTDLVALLNRLTDGRRTKALLFANSRRECDRLASELRNATGFRDHIYVHHSSLSKEIRLEVERAFQEAATALCIATSTLELGIDVGDIDVVLLYGHPGGWDSFLQRIGRGNRRSHKSNVICVASPDHGSLFLTVLGFEALVSQVRSGRIERESAMDIYGAAAQQIMSALLAARGSYQKTADLAGIFDGWPHLNRAVIEEILATLSSGGFVRAHGFKNRYGEAEGLHQLRDLRLVWGNFPTRSRDVSIMLAGRELGTVPATNLLRLASGITTRFAGRYWRVCRVSPDAIEVEPTSATTGIEIVYGGGKVPLDPANVEEMLRILESGISGADLAPSTRDWFVRSANAVRPHVGQARIPFARDADGHHYFTFAGQVVNGAIAQWSGASTFDAGDIRLVSDQPIDFSLLPGTADLESFACQSLYLPENLTIFQAALPPRLLELELGEVWRKTPVFARSLARLRAAKIIPVPLSEVSDLCG